MDRQPLPPPYSVGTRLRYTGTGRSWADAEMQVPLQWPGMEVVIVETKPGHRGSLRLIEIDDLTGEEIRDTTRDAYSVYLNPRGDGRVIRPDNADEWEPLG